MYRPHTAIEVMAISAIKSNLQIIRQINKVLERKPIERQEEILFAIVLNVLGQAVKEKKYDKTDEIINWPIVKLS